MHDWLIMVGTALIGGLILDLQRRTSTRQQVMAGLALVPTGWILALAMTKSGPFPSPMGAAIGLGLLLTGIALLSVPASRSLRERRTTGRNRRA